MSNVGKSLIVAGLCRIFKQDGYKVCPFKSQNMALNSYITADGLEMGRAQVMQAEAAGIAPDVAMNPILLKPTSDVGSQVIVNGEVIGNMKAREYFEYKKKLVPEILKAYEKLDKEYDIIVIEGAGSPAEINLKENDIVNMGMAKLADAPVILVGDIDRGGVFAQLLGTLMLLEEDEKARVKGLVINKFRGDKTILDPGIKMLEEKGNVDVVGVVPYMNFNLDDEDSLTERFERQNHGLIDIAVIRLPHISNFTDFNVFEQTDIINLRYVNDVNSLGNPDMIILPGSKNTIGDMRWLRESGFEAKIKKLASEEKNYMDPAGIDGNKEYEERSYLSTPVFGICGGYQMLGYMIYDEEGNEEGGCIEGMGFLPIDTHICEEKTRKQISGRIGKLTGVFEALSEKEFEGYEIHMGVSYSADNMDTIDNTYSPMVQKENVYGTYVHGIFDKGDIAETIIKALAERKNVNLANIDIKSYKDIKEAEYDKLADTLREFMDMDKVYEIMSV